MLGNSLIFALRLKTMIGVNLRPFKKMLAMASNGRNDEEQVK
jgi:hypothetical protein